MRVSLAAIQSRHDRTLRADLAEKREVQRAVARVEELSSGYGFVGRRQLLSGALRLTRSMSPEVADALLACREVLGYDGPVEMYVRPDPLLNAYCMKLAAGPVVIVLSSRLLEVFTPMELRFVIGHELGHAAFQHFAIPMPSTATVEDMAGILVSRETRLRLFLWCRAAELSADRAGLICAPDPEAAATGFFKLASGLSSPRVRADLEAYATQVDSLASAPGARLKPRDDDDTLDCFSTHPYSPLRVRAVVAFSRSRVYAEATGRPTAGTLSDDELESVVSADFGLMEPSYLEEKSAEADLMRRALHRAGVCVAAANGEIAPSEQEALAALLGKEQLFGGLDPQKARTELDALVPDVLKVSFARRAQLVQHLTIVAAADGQVEPAELAEMHRIAGAFQVSPFVVEQTLSASARPLD